MTKASLEHKTRKIRDLIDEYRKGRLVIPEFQRDYVWKLSRAPTLLDSLYKHWPISSLLVWQHEGDEEVEARRADPRAARGATRWLIDGQQRVITLARIATGDEGIEVVFNRKTAEFLRPNAATRKDSNWVRVTELWDDEEFRARSRDTPDDAEGRRTLEKFDRVRRILDYEVPVVEMVDHEFREAVAAFERINTLGTKLKRADIESAQVASKHSGFIRHSVSPFLKRVHDQGFTRIHVMHLFRACAFVAHPDARNRTPLHELPRKEVDRAWKATQAATQEAINLVRSEFGLVDMSVLWSGAFLVPAIAICARVGPRQRKTKEIAGWMALAALHHRYSGASDTGLDEDLKACRQDDPVGALLGALRSRHGKLTAKESHFGGKLADRSALLAAWIACRFRGARDLMDGGDVVLQPNIDRHHILPRASFEQSERTDADTLANIAFISGRTNRTISDDSPERYLGRIKPAVLKSQCIPTDKNLWSVESAEDFWRARRGLLAEAFNEFLESVLEGRRL